jgi:hypothetical protein
MNEMSVTSVANNPIQLSQEEAPKPVLTRRQESEKRKEDFFAELNQARSGDSPVAVEPVSETVVETPETHETPVEDDVINDENESENLLDSKSIPKKRFDKELEKRKVLESELQRERESRIRAETEMSLYTKAIESMNNTTQQTQRAAEIDPIDTDAHNLYMNRINELEQKYETQNTNLSDYQQRQNFATTVDRQAAEYSKSNPDFNDAYSYLLNVEASKAKLFGYDDSQATQYALEQIKPIAWQAYQSGKNVAEIAYNMAKNYGYKSAKVTTNNLKPNIDNVSKNMPKSYSAIDEVPGVSTSVSKETAAYNNIEGFNRKLSNANGRGINQSEFYKAVEKIRSGY